MRRTDPRPFGRPSRGSSSGGGGRPAGDNTPRDVSPGSSSGGGGGFTVAAQSRSINNSHSLSHNSSTATATAPTPAPPLRRFSPSLSSSTIHTSSGVPPTHSSGHGTPVAGARRSGSPADASSRWSRSSGTVSPFASPVLTSSNNTINNSNAMAAHGRSTSGPGMPPPGLQGISLASGGPMGTAASSSSEELWASIERYLLAAYTALRNGEESELRPLKAPKHRMGWYAVVYNACNGSPANSREFYARLALAISHALEVFVLYPMLQRADRGRLLLVRGQDGAAPNNPVNSAAAAAAVSAAAAAATNTAPGGKGSGGPAEGGVEASGAKTPTMRNGSFKFVRRLLFGETDNSGSHRNSSGGSDAHGAGDLALTGFSPLGGPQGGSGGSRLSTQQQQQQQPTPPHVHTHPGSGSGSASASPAAAHVILLEDDLSSGGRHRDGLGFGHSSGGGTTTTTTSGRNSPRNRAAAHTAHPSPTSRRSRNGGGDDENGNAIHSSGGASVGPLSPHLSHGSTVTLGLRSSSPCLSLGAHSRQSTGPPGVAALVSKDTGRVLVDEEAELLLPELATTAPSWQQKQKPKHESGNASDGQQQQQQQAMLSSSPRSPNYSACKAFIEEHSTFAVFRRVVLSCFRYLDQYYTRRFGMDTLTLMCVKLFYVVVYEPVKPLLMDELFARLARLREHQCGGGGNSAHNNRDVGSSHPRRRTDPRAVGGGGGTAAAVNKSSGDSAGNDREDLRVIQETLAVVTELLAAVQATSSYLVAGDVASSSSTGAAAAAAGGGGGTVTAATVSAFSPGAAAGGSGGARGSPPISGLTAGGGGGSRTSSVSPAPPLGATGYSAGNAPLGEHSSNSGGGASHAALLPNSNPVSAASTPRFGPSGGGGHGGGSPGATPRGTPTASSAAPGSPWGGSNSSGSGWISSGQLQQQQQQQAQQQPPKHHTEKKRRLLMSIFKGSSHSSSQQQQAAVTSAPTTPTAASLQRSVSPPAASVSATESLPPPLVVDLRGTVELRNRLESRSLALSLANQAQRHSELSHSGRAGVSATTAPGRLQQTQQPQTGTIIKQIGKTLPSLVGDDIGDRYLLALEHFYRSERPWRLAASPAERSGGPTSITAAVTARKGYVRWARGALAMERQLLRQVNPAAPFLQSAAHETLSAVLLLEVHRGLMLDAECGMQRLLEVWDGTRQDDEFIVAILGEANLSGCSSSSNRSCSHNLHHGINGEHATTATIVSGGGGGGHLPGEALGYGGSLSSSLSSTTESYNSDSDDVDSDGEEDGDGDGDGDGDHGSSSRHRRRRHDVLATCSSRHQQSRTASVACVTMTSTTAVPSGAFTASPPVSAERIGPRSPSPVVTVVSALDKARAVGAYLGTFALASDNDPCMLLAATVLARKVIRDSAALIAAYIGRLSQLASPSPGGPLSDNDTTANDRDWRHHHQQPAVTRAQQEAAAAAAGNALAKGLVAVHGRYSALVSVHCGAHPVLTAALADAMTEVLNPSRWARGGAAAAASEVRDGVGSGSSGGGGCRADGSTWPSRRHHPNVLLNRDAGVAATAPLAALVAAEPAAVHISMPVLLVTYCDQLCIREVYNSAVVGSNTNNMNSKGLIGTTATTNTPTLAPPLPSGSLLLLQQCGLVAEMAALMDDRDVFFAYYKVRLARRLLLSARNGNSTAAAGSSTSTSGGGVAALSGSSSTGMDLERALLLRLRRRLGAGSTHAYEAMLRDCANTVAARAAFEATNRHRALATKIRVQLLSAVQWPGYRVMALRPHPSLMAGIAAFESHYFRLHPSRALRWLHLLGSARLAAEFPDNESDGGSLEIVAGTLQATILLTVSDAFNKENGYGSSNAVGGSGGGGGGAHGDYDDTAARAAVCDRNGGGDAGEWGSNTDSFIAESRVCSSISSYASAVIDDSDNEDDEELTGRDLRTITTTYSRTAGASPFSAASSGTGGHYGGGRSDTAGIDGGSFVGPESPPRPIDNNTNSSGNGRHRYEFREPSSLLTSSIGLPAALAPCEESRSSSNSPNAAAAAAALNDTSNSSNYHGSYGIAAPSFTSLLANLTSSALSSYRHARQGMMATGSFAAEGSWGGSADGPWDRNTSVSGNANSASYRADDGGSSTHSAQQQQRQATTRQSLTGGRRAARTTSAWSQQQQQRSEAAAAAEVAAAARPRGFITGEGIAQAMGLTFLNIAPHLSSLVAHRGGVPLLLRLEDSTEHGTKVPEARRGRGGGGGRGGPAPPPPAPPSALRPSDRFVLNEGFRHGQRRIQLPAAQHWRIAEGSMDYGLGASSYNNTDSSSGGSGAWARPGGGGGMSRGSSATGALIAGVFAGFSNIASAPSTGPDSGWGSGGSGAAGGVNIAALRQMQLDAAILQTTKAHDGPLAFHQLSALVSRRLAGRFLPASRDIKGRIESLVERGFVERAADNSIAYVV